VAGAAKPRDSGWVFPLGGASSAARRCDQAPAGASGLQPVSQASGSRPSSWAIICGLPPC